VDTDRLAGGEAGRLNLRLDAEDRWEGERLGRAPRVQPVDLEAVPRRSQHQAEADQAAIVACGHGLLLGSGRLMRRGEGSLGP
jgi:hypothetical protein